MISKSSRLGVGSLIRGQVLRGPQDGKWRPAPFFSLLASTSPSHLAQQTVNHIGCTNVLAWDGTMPGKQPVITIHEEVRAAPAFQLYLQLYRQQYEALCKRAAAAGLSQPADGCLVNVVMRWLYIQPALLTDKQTAQFFLRSAMDELVQDALVFQQHHSSVVRPRYLLFHLLAARHPVYFERAIDKLPYPSSEITRLYYQGFSEKEIASRVHIALSIVKRRLSFSLYLLTTQFAKKPKAPV